MGTLENIRQVAYTTAAVSMAAVAVQLPFFLRNAIIFTENANKLVENADKSLSETLKLVNEHAPDALHDLKDLMCGLRTAVDKCNSKETEKIVENINKVLVTTNDTLATVGKEAPGLISEVNYMVKAIEDGYVVFDFELMEGIGKTSFKLLLSSEHSASAMLGIRIVPKYIHDFLMQYDPRSKVEGWKIKDADISKFRKLLYLYDLAVKASDRASMSELRKTIMSTVNGAFNVSSYDLFRVRECFGNFLYDIVRRNVVGEA